MHSCHSGGHGRGWMTRAAWRAYAEHMMAAGRFGHGRGGDDSHGEGRGGRGGFGGPRQGRMLGHGDLRLLLLALIAEKPRHGYDLIRAIEEKFAGAYAPSPGAVYPTLTLLEEQDQIRPEAAEGSKRLYAITPAGEEVLAASAVEVQGIFARIDVAAAAYSSQTAPEAVWEAWKTLKQAMNLPRAPWTEAEAQRIRAILETAARDIVGRPKG